MGSNSDDGGGWIIMAFLCAIIFVMIIFALMGISLGEVPPDLQPYVNKSSPYTYADWFDEPAQPDQLKEMIKCQWLGGIFNFTDSTCRMPTDAV